MGASNHTNHDREENDYYATEPNALESFLKKIEEDKIVLNSSIYEPACGEEHLSEVLSAHGYKVVSTDLINRGYGKGNVDFLKLPNDCVWNGDILTNPPYKFAQEFVEQSLKMITDGNKVVMFLKIQFLEGIKRAKLFKENNPKYVYVASKRLKCALNGDFDSIGSSATAYCWYIWEKGYKGDTIIRWFND